MLKVSEIFGPTIQGEGKSSGKAVTFLRTSLCNLHCIWCDTPYTWNWKDTPFSHPDKYDYNTEVHLMSTDQVVYDIKKIGVKALVISGGEPLLQQKDLLEVVRKLKADNYWIEIETNGTLPIRNDFKQYIDQFNCSPKLSNSKDTATLRLKSAVLKSLAADSKVNFKFVIATRQDADEAITLVKEYGMKEVFFMPEGRTRSEQENVQSDIEDLAREYRVAFSPRLHVLEFGGVRGV